MPSPPNFIFKYLPVLEKLFLLAVIVGFVLDYFFGGLLSVISISMTGLSCITFLYAYKPSEVPHDEDGKRYGINELLTYTVLPKILWISTSVLLIGILFYLMKLSGFLDMIFIGGITTLIGTFLLLMSKLAGTKHINYVMPVLYRSTPALIIGIYIYLQSRPI